MKQVHLIIHGKVQGVWFRTSTKQHAEQLHITGWVCNKSDGTVEAVLQATSQDSLDEMISWCHQGPAHAHVTKIDKEKIPASAYSCHDCDK